MNKTSSPSRFSPELGGKVSTLARTIGSYSLLALAISTACAPISVAGAADWEGGVSGDWFESGNWSTGATPGESDGVTIGRGSVLISGGEADASSLALGTQSLGKASLTVDGADSALTVAGGMHVGDDGTGELTISGGATVESSYSSVGLNGGTGSVTVSGEGSEWNARDISVGYLDGTGSMTVTDGAQVTTQEGLYVGREGGAGSMTVTGAGSVLTAGDDIYVGYLDDGTGELTVTDGAQVTTQEGLYVGFQGGTGEMVITDGATVNIGSGLNVGYLGGGGGILAVSGAGTALTAGDDIYVGTFGGEGEMTVTDGAQVTTQKSLHVGYQGSTGSMTVTGAGTALTAGDDIDVGAYDGEGEMTVTDGAQVTTQEGLNVGFQGSTGSMTVTGAGTALTAGGNMYVGDDGTGELTISGGATVESSYSSVGLNGGTGSVTVSGEGSEWNARDISVGYIDGTGELTVTDGAQVTTQEKLYVGRSGGAGSMTVTGGATVESGYSSVGLYGSTGSVTVSDEGSEWNARDISVGYLDGTGSMTVTDGAQVTAQEGLYVGRSGGTGELVITDGATVNTALMNVGTDFVEESNPPTDAAGSVTVSGAGSALTVASGVCVGCVVGGPPAVGVTARPSGELAIAGGATVESGRSSVGLYGGTGTVTVSGEGSEWNARDLSVGYLNGSTGKMTVTDGAQVTAQENLYVGRDGGTGELTVTNGATVTVGETLSLSGGRLPGSSSVLNVSGQNGQTAISAQQAVIGPDATLNISGYNGQAAGSTGELGNSVMTVIHTAEPGALTGDFSSVTIGGSTSPVDYLTVTTMSDGQDYQVGMGLTWYAAEGVSPENASGTFTLTGADEVFDVGVVLADQAANAQTGWDGTSLTKAGEGTLILSSDNTYTGGTTIQEGTLQLGNGGTTGSVLGNIANNGSLVVNRSDAYTYNGVISGSGSLTQQGTGSLILNQDQSYTGATNVNAGALILEDGARLTGTSQVTVAEGATLGGNGGVAGDVVNNGTLAVGGMTTTRAAGTAGNTLTIDGNYTGNNGTLILNTELGGDDSVTDKLVVAGDTSGNTQVVVNNTYGGGNQTVDGIEIISVGGQSDGEFTLANRVVAGAYEYQLTQGIDGNNDGNWYLDSTKLYRPEAGSYLNNMSLARTMFNLSLADREGHAEDSTLWLRQTGTHNRSRDGSGQLKTTSNSYVVQGGGEVLATQFGENDRLGLGVMLGYGNTKSNTSSASSYSSEGSLDGYTAGLYATWYQDAQSQKGAYVDTWLQYSWLNAGVQGDELSNESYDIRGLSGSVESGYRLPVYQGLNGDVFVTPQAQVIWNGMQADDVTESNGTQVQTKDSDNIQSRVGVKLSRDGVSTMDKGKDRLFTTYVETNWLYNSNPSSVTLDGERIDQDGSRNIGEVKLGVEGKLNKQLQVWGNVKQQLGDAGYSESSLMLGVKYGF